MLVLTIKALLKTAALSLLFTLTLLTSANAEERIVSGNKASIKEWPSTVSIVSRQDYLGGKMRSAYWGHFCGGTLLTKRWVLTAAHCLEDIQKVDVVIGRENLLRINKGEKVVGTYLKRNPSWSADSLTGLDLGLVRLQKPARFGKPLGLNNISTPKEGLAKVAGWGVSRTNRPPYLQQAEVPVQNPDVCAAAYPENDSSFAVSAFCAGGSAQDACYGDSGGPIMQQGKLIGVVSWGEGCGERGFPGVYSLIDKEFVNRAISKHFPQKTKKTWIKERPVKEKRGWKPENIAMMTVYWARTDPEEPNLEKEEVYFDLEINVQSVFPIENPSITFLGESPLCPGTSDDGPGPECPEGTEINDSISIDYGNSGFSWAGWSRACGDVTLSFESGGKKREEFFSARESCP